MRTSDVDTVVDTLPGAPPRERVGMKDHLASATPSSLTTNRRRVDADILKLPIIERTDWCEMFGIPNSFRSPPEKLQELPYAPKQCDEHPNPLSLNRTTVASWMCTLLHVRVYPKSTSEASTF